MQHLPSEHTEHWRHKQLILQNIIFKSGFKDALFLADICT